MTPFDIESLPFSRESVTKWAPLNPRNSNWPVVYVLDSASQKVAQLGDVYVGESLNVAVRMRQHLDSAEKKHLSTIRVVVDDTFNKSVCLDLESYLIRMLSGDGTYRVLNRNDGITDSDYYERERYRETFREVFEQLKNDGVFSRSIAEIENSDLFKLSPFKALTTDQGVAVTGIVEGLFEDLQAGKDSMTVVQGEPGTGKTVVAIYLLKLLMDIANSAPDEDTEADTLFSEFFVEENREALTGVRVGIVVPQQSLRKSIQKVFRKTPGLHPDMVMTPFQVGEADGIFDVLIVDEAHRLNQRANQAAGSLNIKFSNITTALFGSDDKSKTQIDWIRAKSRHQILLVDTAQSVRPADVPIELLNQLVSEAKTTHRHHPLLSQMRVKSSTDFVGYVRSLLNNDSPARLSEEDLGKYEFTLFDSVAEMRDAIVQKDQEVGLSRLIAGFAWEWKSKNDKSAYDIDIDGHLFRWNSTQTDWIASKGSLNEVGSIHTVQGYDLNYAGVIIGNDLRYDPARGGVYFDGTSYFDKKGKENNPLLGRKLTDDDLLRYVRNVYSVLLTRGIFGTYVYVCDPDLRDHLRTLI
jgi:DUF2075 family protein